MPEGTRALVVAPTDQPSTRSILVAWCALGAACLWALLNVVSIRVGVTLGLLAIVFVSPGVVFVGRMSSWRPHLLWLFAPAVGYVLSSLALLGFWTLGMRGVSLVPLSVLLASAIAVWLGARVTDLVRPVPGTRRDLLALALVLMLVPATVGRPFSQVGAVPPGHVGGEAYRAYFTADVVWAMAAVSEVSKGDVPPKNPFRRGARLHYYWLAHLFQAVEHRALPSLRLHSLVLANGIFSGLAFVSSLYALARCFTTRTVTAACGVVAALWATSFEGAQQLVALWEMGRPLSLVRHMNIDAVTRWVFNGMPVDGLQRLLLYQPQHQLGYSLTMLAFVYAVRAVRVDQVRLGLLVGVTLGCSLLISTFSAFMMTIVVAVVLAVRFLRIRGWFSACLVAGAAAVPLVMAVGLTQALAYVEHGAGPLVAVTWNEVAFVRWPLLLFLSMGPIGLVLAVRMGLWTTGSPSATDEPVWPLLSLIAVSIAFYFFADVRDHQHVYVGWRAGHLIFIAYAALLAATLEVVSRLKRWARHGLYGLIALGAVTALPTSAIDLYNTQDISNFELASTFRWTTWLTPDELDGLAWVRTQTPLSAVVQPDTRAHGTQTWALIPAFAERRMAGGLPISMIPLAKYERANALAVEVFDATAADDVVERSRRLGIDYLWYGPGEQILHPGMVTMLEASPRCRVPFRNATVAVVRCH